MEFITGVNRKETLEISELISGGWEGKTVTVNGAEIFQDWSRKNFKRIGLERSLEILSRLEP